MIDKHRLIVDISITYNQAMLINETINRTKEQLKAQRALVILYKEQFDFEDYVNIMGTLDKAEEKMKPYV